MTIVNYEDEFDLPPVDYDRNKVPKSIKDRAEGVRDAIFGKQNKEFLAQSVEISGLLSSEAKASSEQISLKQKSLEQRFLTLQQETTNGDFNSAPEIIDARGGKATLGQRLDATAAQLAHKAEQSALNAEKARIDNLIAVEQTVDNAETADIRVDAFGKTWASGGASVRGNINNLYDELRNGVSELNTLVNFVSGYRVSGYDATTFLPNITALANFKYCLLSGLAETVTITSDALYTIGLVLGDATPSHSLVMIVDADGKHLSSISGKTPTTMGTWFVVGEFGYTINTANLLVAYPTADKIYFCMNTDYEVGWNINKQSIEDRFVENESDIDNLKNLVSTTFALTDKFSFVDNYRIRSYDTTTMQLIIGANTSYKYIKITDIKTIKTLVQDAVYTQNLNAAHWLFALTDGNDQFLYSMSGLTVDTTAWYDLTTVDVEKLLELYPTAENLYITMQKTTAVNFTINYYSSTENIVKLNEMISGNDKKIILPPYIPCVIGKQIHVYMDNILQYGNYYTAEKFVVEGKGGIIEGGYRYEPLLGAVDTTLVFNYYDGKRVVNTESTTVKPVPSGAGTGLTKKIMVIGESTTDNGSFRSELLNLFASDSMGAEFLGTRGTAPAVNEARAGWKISNFLTSATYGDPADANAFYNPATSGFDFTYYMTQQGYSGVDYVAIDFGFNDSGRVISDIIADYNTMIANIRAYDPNIKIFLGLSNLPERFANNSQYYLKDTVLSLIDGLITEFGNREGEGFFLVPIYTNLDPYWDMQYSEVAVSARNEKTTFIGTNNVHPSTIGYYKSADAHYNAFKYAVSLE